MDKLFNHLAYLPETLKNLSQVSRRLSSGIIPKKEPINLWVGPGKHASEHPKSYKVALAHYLGEIYPGCFSIPAIPVLTANGLHAMISILSLF